MAENVGIGVGVQEVTVQEVTVQEVVGVVLSQHQQLKHVCININVANAKVKNKDAFTHIFAHHHDTKI